MEKDKDKIRQRLDTEEKGAEGAERTDKTRGSDRGAGRIR